MEYYRDPEPFDPEKERGALFGLTEKSSNEEIVRTVFQAAAKARCFSFTTMSPDGKHAHAHLLSFYQLSDGNLYFGTARGKCGYEDMENNPRVSLVGTFYEEERLLAYGIRMNTTVAKATNPAMVEEYWRINWDTKWMYAKGLELFEIYCLSHGEGEFMHVYSAGHVAKLRFGFGGERPAPPRYAITKNCTQCGACAEACLTGTIKKGAEGYFIRSMDCLDCGKCRAVCPVPTAISVYRDGVYTND